MNEFTMTVKEINGDGEIVATGEKLVYNLDEQENASKWARQDLPKERIDIPQLAGALKVKQEGKGRVCIGHIGYIVSGSNNVYKNLNRVFILSDGCMPNGKGSGGFTVLPENFNRVVALFAARKTIKGNWINDKDEYMSPNEYHPEYDQWVNDAIVYALFNGSSQQSSMRAVEYNGKEWDIQNEWFWMSNEEMQQLANDHNNTEVFHDAKRFKDRFVYNRLQEVTLSPDAQELLDEASRLVRESFKYRVEMDEDNHLNTWDAGWYQIKIILKEYMPDEYKAFVAKYKAFEGRMREGVYKFGFLKGEFVSCS